jgi:hypothetical protein
MARQSRTDVIDAIKAASKSFGGGPLSQTQFFQMSSVTISDVLRFFPKWSDACRAAGVEHDSSRERVPDDGLLADWGRVTRNLGHVPSLAEYKVEGKFSRNSFDRFGQSADVPAAFDRAFTGSNEWQDVLAMQEHRPPARAPVRKPAEPKIGRQLSERSWPKLDKRPIYGAPIDSRGLRHEPVNEQGVVFLFGMVARELGYLVEAVQGGFPDCEAKRQVSKWQWQPVRIEFEYESRSFLEHGYEPAKCDVIVCWVDNWPECPASIEVVALSDEITKL